MKQITKLIAFSMLFLTSILAQDATMEIVKRMDTAPMIMVQDGTDNSFDGTFKNRFFKMLIGDLKTTTHFNPINTYVTSNYDNDPIANVGDKRPNLILQYKLQRADAGAIIAKVKFVNTANLQVRSETSYDIPEKSRYPFLSHRIISDINDNIGAPSVNWMKRYVLISKNVAPMKSQIIIADYTLTFQKTIVKGGLNLFPKWANEAQSAFYYSSYSDKNPTLYKVELKSGTRSKIISSNGMLACSDVSKDNQKLLLTMAPKGQTDIYMYNVNSKQLKQVTFYKGIDVNGGFVDNDKKIVFVSDRLGYPNIFSKNINSRGVEQMVYHGRNNNASSSYGKYIAYSSRDKESEFGSSTFNLYLISTRTDYIRQLTAAGKNLFPRFSNDGGSILFIKEYGRQSALGLIRLNENKTFHFPLQVGKIQSIDW